MTATQRDTTKDDLTQRYREFQSRGIRLDMTRGKPCPEQLDLFAVLLDGVDRKAYKAADGTDCRNYGGLDGIPEAKALFAEYMGVTPEELIIGGSSSLTMMHDALTWAMVFGAAAGSPPWSRQGPVKFLCPSPGYDRHFAICQHLGIEMIPVAMKADGPDMVAVEQIAACRLGWDITDFGQGNFARRGLFLFTLRNGRPGPNAPLPRKTYAEKILIVEEGQLTPLHFHWSKMEDIINRGGELVVQLFNALPDEQPDRESPVTVWTDGMQRTVPAGGTLTLAPGESITLPQRNYHAFWAQGGKLLLGEVSQVNDDDADNRFAEPLGRFPAIVEDEAPRHLLCTDYPRYLPGLANPIPSP